MNKGSCPRKPGSCPLAHSASETARASRGTVCCRDCTNWETGSTDWFRSTESEWPQVAPAIQTTADKNRSKQSQKILLPETRIAAKVPAAIPAYPETQPAAA